MEKDQNKLEALQNQLEILQTEMATVQYEMKVLQKPCEVDEITLPGHQIPVEAADQATPSDTQRTLQEDSPSALLYNGFRVVIVLALFIGMLIEAMTVRSSMLVGRGPKSRGHMIYAPEFVKAVPITAGVSFAVALLSLIVPCCINPKHVANMDKPNVGQLATQVGMSAALLTTSIIMKVKQQQAGCMSSSASSELPACLGGSLGADTGIGLGVLCAMLVLTHVNLFVRTLWTKRATAKSNGADATAIV